MNDPESRLDRPAATAADMAAFESRLAGLPGTQQDVILLHGEALADPVNLDGGLPTARDAPAEHHDPSVGLPGADIVPANATTV